MSQELNGVNTLFFDFFSFPNNPEELFTLLYLIGKNDNYEIYKAIYKETREVFCIKIIPLDRKINEKEKYSTFFFEKLKQETLLNKSIKNCDYITKYHGSFLSLKNKNIWLIYEYCPAGSLYDIMKIIDRPLTEKEISIIMNDILHGLIYIHQLNIIHKDIKLTNILLNEKGISKLNNFNKSIQQLNNNLLISINSDNNEDLNDPKFDIFLLGITCIELFLGIKDNSFDRKIIIDNLKNNNPSLKKMLEKELLYLNDKHISKEFFEFIQKCIELNPYKRPTAYELNNHRFIKKNCNSLEKVNFINSIRFNIEKVENYKKENYKKANFISSNKKLEFDNSILSHNKNNIKSNISFNDKSSLNISNLNNITNNNVNDDDKIAEFNIKQFGREDETLENENEKFTNKDLYSNIDNTAINNGDESLNVTLKESAVFGKGMQIDKNKSFEIQKKS